MRKKSFTNAENDDGSWVRFPTDVKSADFRSQLKAFRVSSHIEALCFNETVCTWITIYIYIYIYRERERQREGGRGRETEAVKDIWFPGSFFFLP